MTAMIESAAASVDSAEQNSHANALLQDPIEFMPEEKREEVQGILDHIANIYARCSVSNAYIKWFTEEQSHNLSALPVQDYPSTVQRVRVLSILLWRLTTGAGCQGRRISRTPRKIDMRRVGLL